MNQTVRIIGGRYRGKKISFPSMDGLRPTPDRVRETLFNWLMHDIYGASCLDAFAGSGALGFEAFSRGARRVVFIDAAKEAYVHLKKTAHSFDADSLSIIHNDAIAYLSHTQESFDLVFLDPPFIHTTYLPQCLDILAHRPVLKTGGLVYLEAPDKLSINETEWIEIKLKQTGRVVYGLYKKTALPKGMESLART